jgi:hypothetical protein
VGSLAFVAADQAPEPGDPLQAALDNVAVSTEAVRCLDAFTSDPGLDPAPCQGLPAGPVVVALVTVQFHRPFPWAADRLPNGCDTVNNVFEHLVVVDVGSRDVGVQRKPVPVTECVNLGTGLAAVYRARPRQVPPFNTRTCMASILARDQSICPAAPSTSSIARCSAAITPCSTHSLNRRCAVAEEIGNDSGSSFQAQPESSTYRIAASAIRSLIRRRPPL